jgi:hypothetical protein
VHLACGCPRGGGASQWTIHARFRWEAYVCGGFSPHAHALGGECGVMGVGSGNHERGGVQVLAQLVHLITPIACMRCKQHCF